mgnify:CR=1 FL=1
MLALPMSTQTVLCVIFSMMASAWIYNNAVTNHDNSWSLHFAIPDDKRLELVAATNAIVNSENNRARRYTPCSI